jgi:hypothetical protein
LLARPFSAQQASYPLDFSVVSHERMIQASIAGNEKSDPGMDEPSV